PRPLRPFPPRRSSGLAEVLRPPRVRDAVAQHPPRGAARGPGHRVQPPPELGGRTVPLAVVAAGAGRHDVLPGVPAATAAGNDVRSEEHTSELQSRENL